MAMTLADIRAKYPYYANVDDQTLADAIYKKYYAHADRREFDARVGLKPYDSPVDAVVKAAQSAVPLWNQSEGGISQAVGEAVNQSANRETPPTLQGPFDLPGLLNIGVQALPDAVRRNIAQWGAKEALTGALRAQQAEKDIKPIDAPALSPAGITGVVATSIPQMAPAMFASIALRNPSPALAGAYAQTFGQAYATGRELPKDWQKNFLNEADNLGLDPRQAREYANLYGLAEAIPEVLPVGQILKEGGKLIPRIVKSAVAEGATEGITQAVQSALDKGYITPDMTWQQAWPQIVQAMAAGAITGGFFGIAGHGGEKATRPPAPPADKPTPPPAPPEAPTTEPDTPIEDRLALPAPTTLLALPSPDAFKPPEIARRQPAPPAAPDAGIAAAVVPEVDPDIAAREALQRTKQAETRALLDTARETVTPLGTFTLDEVGGPAAQRVRQRRVQLGRSVEAPVSIAELADAKVPQPQIDALIAKRRPRTTEAALSPLDVQRTAESKNIRMDGNFAELARRTTGQSNVSRMTQAQLHALNTTLEAMPAHEAPVTVPIIDTPRFSDEQYGKAVDAVRKQGRYTAAAIRAATGLKSNQDVAAVRDAMVRRGQLVKHSDGDFRLYDVTGQERQTTPDDLPPGAFSNYVVARIPVSKVRIKVNGKSVGTFGSKTEARTKISEIRAAEAASNAARPAEVSLEPAADVAYGVMENRYDEQGNLLGQVVVDTHRNEADARAAADKLGTPDTGARYTQTAVEPTPAPPKPAPIRKVAPAGLVGRVQEVLDNLNALAKQRALPLLGVKVQLKTAVTTPEGDAVEGTYWKKLIQLTTEHLDPRMNTDEIVDRLAQVMDHELIHALRAAGLLGADTAGWKSLARYVMKAKRPGSRETYQQWADRVYSPIPGYETAESRVEEAIAEAFRYWARNRRAVSGQPATVFRQLVEWFKRLISSVPEDIFQSIESGELVRTALRPPGSSQPRAEATTKMEEAAKGVSEAQAAKDENLVRVRSREYLRARAQAREDRKGRSGPKTILGSTPTKTYETGKVMDRATVQGIVDRFKEMAGVTAERLRTLLPIDTDFMKRVADAQQKALHMPQADAVAKAYRALADETKAMFKALVHPDIQIEAWTKDGPPYKNAAEITDDIIAGRLKIRLTADMFGQSPDFPNHPMNAPSGFKTKDGKDLTLNDIFRVVHDVYGHGQSGFRDGPQGAYNAYHEHARLLSPLARQALATETLAQRAWQDFGPHLRRKDGTVPRPTDVDYLPDNKKEFAQQKAFLLDPELLAADPGLARAERADGIDEQVDASNTPRYSRFADELPGGKLYGNPKRSPGGVISKPDTPAPAFSSDRPGNRFFAGPLADAQLEMAQLGVDGATMVYLSPDDFLTLADPTENPEQAVYDDAIRTGYKFAGIPSLVIDGYAGIVRAVKSDGAAMVRALRDMGERIPVVLYPSKKEGIGLVVAIEGRGERVEPQRFSVGSPEFKRWFGDSKMVDENGAPRVYYHGTRQTFNAFRPNFRPSEQLGFGIHFAEDESFADAYANDANVARKGATPRVIPAYLAVRNPLVATQIVRQGSPEFELAKKIAGPNFFSVKDENGVPAVWLQNAIDNASPRRAEKMIREAGYDGVIYQSTVRTSDGRTVRKGNAVVVFEPTQAKSATENVGTYDPTNPDIRYSVGERVLWPHEGRAEYFPEKRGRLSVGSPEFRRWFGDSKAVSAQTGQPLVAYHASKNSFNQFEKTETFPGNVTNGFYVTFDPNYNYIRHAENLGEGAQVYPLFVRIENPYFAKNENEIEGLNVYNDAPEFIQKLKDQGYDSVVWGDPNDLTRPPQGAWGDQRSQVFVFEPTQLKSAVANKGTWDATNPDIRYSMNAPVGERLPNEDPSMRNVVHQRTEGMIGRFLKSLGRSKRSLAGLPSIFDARVKLQDKMLSWKEIAEYALEHGGEINDLNDVYMLEQLYHGKVFHELEAREKNLQLPLLEALKAAHDGPLKIMPKDLEDYLYARHAAERNAYLRARGAPDENPSGMSDEEAGSILDRFALDGKQPALERLAAMVDAITADTTRTRVEAGLITEEAAASSPYEHYVPLRGFAEEELDPDNPSVNQTRARSGRGFSVGGREDRTVTGRERKAGDILGHVFLQNTEAVIRAQKNEVSLAAMRLLQQNKGLGIGEVLKSAPTRRVVGANGMIHEAGDPTYRQRPDIITAKWKGREIVARLDDPRLARAIKSDYVTTSNMLVQALGHINRHLATVNTSLNPEFMVSNFAKDMQTAGILAQQYDIKNLGTRIIKGAPGAMAGIREVLRSGTATSDWAKAFVELQEAGGTTEFMGIHDLEAKVRAIRNSVTKTGWHTTARQAQEYIGKVFGFIEDYNKVVENALRLSAYKTAIEAGVSKPQAAYLAKNLTVNFNKGGEWKTAANAMYLFYNAGVQGSFAILNGLKNKKVRRIVAAVTVAGILMDIINRLISGDDDDNGVPDYDDIPDYVLETNLVVMMPWHDAKGHKAYLSVPMPYGFNAFYNLGRNLSAGFSGSPVRNPGRSAVDSLLTFVDAYNPLGGAQNIWNFLAPTIVDPVVDLLTNTDYAGKKIVPERFDRPGNVPVPDSQKFWSSTAEPPKWIAAQLNALTGGTEVRKGAIDISPEQLQYGLDFTFGSVGKFVQRLTAFGTETVPKMVQGDLENIDIGEIPFARRVVGSITNRNNTERYYNVAQDVATVKDEIKFYVDAGKLDLARQVRDKYPTEFKLIPAFDEVAKALTKLNEKERAVRAAPKMDEARRKELLDKIQAEQDRLMTLANRRYFEMMKTSR